MIINKVINNNVLSTHDENNRGIVLMGKGIGFQKKVGDEVAELFQLGDVQPGVNFAIFPKSTSGSKVLCLA